MSFLIIILNFYISIFYYLFIYFYLSIHLFILLLFFNFYFIVRRLAFTFVVHILTLQSPVLRERLYKNSLSKWGIPQAILQALSYTLLVYVL